MYYLDGYVVYFPVTGTLPFLTLNSSSTVSSGDDNYGGSVSTGAAFEFGDGYIYSVYVSTVQNDTCIRAYIHAYVHTCMLL